MYVQYIVQCKFPPYKVHTIFILYAVTTVLCSVYCTVHCRVTYTVPNKKPSFKVTGSQDSNFKFLLDKLILQYYGPVFSILKANMDLILIFVSNFLLRGVIDTFVLKI